MTQISNSTAALLGLLTEEPMYPYQIVKAVKWRDMRFWTELSMSSIYKLLRKCEKEGLVRRTDRISPESRLRKLYTLSAKGRKALEEKIADLLSQPNHTRWPVDIGIYNCDLLPQAAVRRALGNYRAELEEKIRCYKALLEFLRKEGCPAHRFGVATRPVFLLKGEIRWVDAFLSQLEKTDRREKKEDRNE